MMEHFKKSWESFGKDELDEALELLTIRLDRNEVNTNIIINKICLDSGCGSGRYSYALKKLGAKSVVGLDKDISKAEKYIGIEGLTFKEGDVLNLPFKDKTFDFVFSNGVLHHTEDIEKGLKECIRVLKRGGYIWLYLCTNNEYFIIADKIKKALNKNVTPEEFIFSLSEFLPSNKIFFALDNYYSDRVYLTRKECEDIIERNGLEIIKFLDKGVDFDVNEKMRKSEEFRRLYGEGDLKYILRK